MSRCRSCDAEIVWAITSAGRRMPVDAAVDDGGNLVLVPDGDDPLVLVVGADDTRPRHRPHFATCPDADDWRRNRKENDS